MRLKLVKMIMIKIDSNVVQDMVMNEGYVYEALGNHDVEDNDVDKIFEHVEHQRMHLDHEYVIPSPMMSELNWDVINATSQENLGPCGGMWNNQDVLNKGLRFENKKD